MVNQAQAVIFDMDGVLVDSEPFHEQAFLQVIREIGFGERHGIRFADYVGRSDQELWKDFVTTHKPAQTLQQLLEMKRRVVVEMLRREQPLFEGLVEVVSSLARNYSLAVASGSERLVVEEVLALGGLGRFFQTVVTAADVAHGKPEPDIFLRAAELLGVAPRDCWVVEDSKPGVAAGLAAGMRVIAITNTHPAEELSHATYVVRTCAELGEVLLDQVKGLPGWRRPAH